MKNRSVSADDIIHLLQGFYAAFGVADEGPPDGFDNGRFPPDLSPSQDDIALLQATLQDKTVNKQFRICREIVDELATRLTSKELLQEFSSLPNCQDEKFDDLANGVFWYTLAASLDNRDVDGLPVTPF